MCEMTMQIEYMWVQCGRTREQRQSGGGFK
jgi:hypothetical protein